MVLQDQEEFKYSLDLNQENEVNAYRNSIAGYIDVEADFSEIFRLTGALRYENFSDFGGTLNGKLSFLVDVIR